MLPFVNVLTHALVKTCIGQNTWQTLITYMCSDQFTPPPRMIANIIIKQCIKCFTALSQLNYFLLHRHPHFIDEETVAGRP